MSLQIPTMTRSEAEDIGFQQDLRLGYYQIIFPNTQTFYSGKKTPISLDNINSGNSQYTILEVAKITSKIIGYVSTTHSRISQIP